MGSRDISATQTYVQAKYLHTQNDFLKEDYYYYYLRERERENICTYCGGHVEVTGRLPGVGSLRPSARFRGRCSSHQTWWRIPHPWSLLTAPKLTALNGLLEKKHASSQ